MKQPSVSLFRRFFHPVLLVLGVLITITACSSGGAEDLVGTWHFASGETDGVSTAVHGTLKLEASRRYEDNHRIAGILTFTKGTWSVSGGNLTLTPDSGTGSPMTYTAQVGPHKDKDGNEFAALTLKSPSGGLTFLLTKESKP
jgi:hypothetical protein